MRRVAGGLGKLALSVDSAELGEQKCQAAGGCAISGGGMVLSGG